MADIKVKISAKNLGPHEDLVFNDSLSTLKVVVYGSNGNGKTFLSRIFQCLDTSDADEAIKKANKLISFGKTATQFLLSINNNADVKKPIRTLSVNLEKTKLPIIKNETDYIFHTFNSDYVKENLEVINYKPEGGIEGYILGKDVIDLSKEKAQQEELIKEIQEKKSDLIHIVKKAKEELDELNVNKNITEYKNLTFESILTSQIPYEIPGNFEDFKAQNTRLNTLPDNLPDVPKLPSGPSIQFLDPINLLLSKPFSKSQFSEEFKNKIKAKQEFVEHGLALVSNSTCPFCEQSFDTHATDLIDRYTKYLADQEASVIRDATTQIKQLASFKEQLEEYSSQYLKIKDKFNYLKGYLPSFGSVYLKDINPFDEFYIAIENVISKLELKKSNIEHVIEASELADIQSIKLRMAELGNWIDKNNQLIASINTKKSNLSSEKLTIKKNLCISKHLELLTVHSTLLTELKNKQSDLVKVEADIANKENKIKSSKKTKVSETFQHFLNEFFAGKYTFDSVNFCLKFNEENLIENASDVLSEGEKSIVAFCFYLAETHRKISTIEDYKNLFFIIDDPISSLDFHYVYSVAQIIRSLDKVFEVEKSRFIIFSHNIEFVSILMRNEIVKDHFILKKEKLLHLNKDLIMPYEAHLRDVYEVTKGVAKPSHTLPNSIRHIIETINKFESPDENLKTYFDHQPELQENAFLYSLIQDISHGVYRTEKPYTEEMIVNGCTKLLAFVGKKYGGQIKQLEKT